MENHHQKDLKTCLFVCDISYDNDFTTGTAELPTNQKLPDWEVLNQCDSPIGAVAMVSKKYDRGDEKSVRDLVIAFRGTSQKNPSSYVIDVGYAYSTPDDSKDLIEEFKKEFKLPWYGDLALVAHRYFEEQISSASQECFLAGAITALTFVRRTLKRYDEKFKSQRRIILTGHSLGGIYAQCLGSYFKVETITFNSPGASSVETTILSKFSEFDYGSELPAQSMEIINYSLRGDKIGAYGKCIGTRKFLNYSFTSDIILLADIDKVFQSFLYEFVEYLSSMEMNHDEVDSLQKQCQDLKTEVERMQSDPKHKGWFSNSNELNVKIAQQKEKRMLLEKIELVPVLRGMILNNPGTFKEKTEIIEKYLDSFIEWRDRLKVIKEKDIPWMKFVRNHSLDAISFVMGFIDL